MDLMTDIETMGTPEPDANVAMVSLGACLFDPLSDEILETFYTRIDLNSGIDKGMRVTESTIKWWKEQSTEARAEIEKGGPSLAVAMHNFAMWLSNLPFKVLHVWANDPDFDVAIIRCNMHAVKARWPFRFYQPRSLRTLKDAAWPNGGGPNPQVEGPKHHALTDTIRQAKIVQLSQKELIRVRAQAHLYQTLASQQKPTETTLAAAD